MNNPEGHRLTKQPPQKMDISITNPGKAPHSEAGQKFYLKVAEHGHMIKTNLNKYGVMALAKEANDAEFLQLAQGIDLKEIVRNANKIVIHF